MPGVDGRRRGDNNNEEDRLPLGVAVDLASYLAAPVVRFLCSLLLALLVGERTWWWWRVGYILRLEKSPPPATCRRAGLKRKWSMRPCRGTEPDVSSFKIDRQKILFMEFHRSSIGFRLSFPFIGSAFLRTLSFLFKEWRMFFWQRWTYHMTFFWTRPSMIRQVFFIGYKFTT